MFSFLNNIPQVTKNILILNVFLFIVTFLFEQQGVDLSRILGAFYINSPLFKPFQVITHFFMHGNLWHILLNMWLFVMLGAFLENLWGAKRFFIFYFASAIGAFALYNIIGMIQLMELRNYLSGYLNMETFDRIIKNASDFNDMADKIGQYLATVPDVPGINIGESLSKYVSLTNTPMVGASGAVFGILAAFAILFPNTEFLLYFTIPVKAKYLVGAYFLWELYQSFNATAGDNVAHLAHVGGAIVGAVLVLIWRKTDKQNFW